MVKHISLFFIGIFFLQAAYSQKALIDSISFITTESGLKYFIFEEGKGENAKEGDILYIHYIGRLEDSTVFENTYEKNYPLIFTLGMGQVIKGWEEGFQLLGEGDKALMVVPPELGYGENPNYNIPPNATLTFMIEVIHVIKGQTILPYKTENKDTITTGTGLKYVVIDQGFGVSPKQKDIVTVDYTGFLSNGKIFDSSVKRAKPLKFSIGDGKVLKAWEEGIQKINEGGRIKLILSPDLAYGDKGFKNIIPPNETLSFDILLMEVKPEINVVPFDISGKEEIETESGLKIVFIEKGDGPIPDTNKVVTVHYSGFFKNGEMFDSSVKRDDPIQFPIGIGAVIKGWEEALFMMPVGSKARVFVPYKLGYGKSGNPPVIPRKADLIFDIELLKIM